MGSNPAFIGTLVDVVLFLTAVFSVYVVLVNNNLEEGTSNRRRHLMIDRITQFFYKLFKLSPETAGLFEDAITF